MKELKSQYRSVVWEEKREEKKSCREKKKIKRQ